jgi:hypothetical protein
MAVRKTIQHRERHNINRRAEPEIPTKIHHLNITTTETLCMQLIHIKHNSNKNSRKAITKTRSNRHRIDGSKSPKSPKQRKQKEQGPSTTLHEMNRSEHSIEHKQTELE